VYVRAHVCVCVCVCVCWGGPPKPPPPPPRTCSCCHMSSCVHIARTHVDFVSLATRCACTSSRYIKHTYPRGRSPFTRGSFMANLSALWCGPKVPSILRLRHPLLDEHFMEVERVSVILSTDPLPLHELFYLCSCCAYRTQHLSFYMPLDTHARLTACLLAHALHRLCRLAHIISTRTDTHAARTAFFPLQESTASGSVGERRENVVFTSA
jgi:hypothetical protein